MKTDLERVLNDIAEEVPPVHEVPGGMLQRARRRIALTVSVTFLALSAAGGGAFAAVQAANSPHPPRPAATGPTSIPTTAASPTRIATTPNPVWAQLARPLHLPTISPGAPCPVTQPVGLPPNRVYSKSSWIDWTGPGPVYVGNLAFRGKPYPARYESTPIRGWYPGKLLWVSTPAYRGPILVRGRQLGGPNGIRFGGLENRPAGIPEFAEGRLVPSKNNQEYLNPGLRPSGWHSWAATVFFRAPGCYAIQMDGLAFSEVVVCRAGP